jgi:hypothetical protein
VKLPNAQEAVIAEDKLRLYLLNTTHRRGGSKAKLLVSLGYSPVDWRRFGADLRDQHLDVDISRQISTEYGERFEVVAPLRGPNGRAVTFRSIWQIDTGSDYPRLITIYPE